MTAKTAKDAIVVPVAAVFHSEEAGDYVLVAGSDSKAHQKKVQVGIRNKDSAQIVSGITEGDAVITTGGYAVPDGTKIKIESPEKEKEESAGSKDEKDTKDAADEKGEKGAKKDAKPDGGAKKSAGKGKE
jgi:hypothetical protein